MARWPSAGAIREHFESQVTRFNASQNQIVVEVQLFPGKLTRIQRVAHRY
jgi:hypothetical protein